MKKEIVNSFLDFLKILEKQNKEGFKFPSIDQVILHLSMSSDPIENDSFISIGAGEYVALISKNIFPDELEYVRKIGNFNIIIMELAHLNRVFLTRKPLITWTM